MTTITVTDQNFEAEVINSEIPVLVDLWAEWCAPCKQIAPALEELAAEYEGRIKIAKVDVDQNPQVAQDLHVRGIPALFMFKGGQAHSNRTGAAPKASLKQWIEESL